MNDWELLTKHAILGTERQAFSLPKTQSPLSSLSAQLETKEPAEKLLHSAALLTEYRRIGWQPLSFDEKPPLVPSQAETQGYRSIKCYHLTVLMDSITEVILYN